MSDIAAYNPTERFTGLAEVYARHRPDYPAAALDWILKTCGLQPGSDLVDVGSGTGIAARLFAQRGLHVIGIEPNEAMRNRAAEELVPPGMTPPEYHDGRSEATGLPDQCCDAVLAAQAFHWFDGAVTLPEFRRILKPGGWVVLLGNERDETDAFTAAYGAVIQSVPEAVVVEALRRERSNAPLLASPLFQHSQTVPFVHEQELDEEGLLGRAFSGSYAPREPAAAAAFTAALRDTFVRFQRAGKVRLKYVTTVTLAQRPI